MKKVKVSSCLSLFNKLTMESINTTFQNQKSIVQQLYLHVINGFERK